MEIAVLGHIVSACRGAGAGVRVDYTKLIGLDDVPIPSTAKQIQSFLGFCNFFRKFIPAFSTLSAPLGALRFLPGVFELDTVQLMAFENMKAALQSAPILALPDFTRPFGLATDASSTGVGCVLL